MSVYKDKLVKVKRRRVNWNDVRIELGINEVNIAFYRLLHKHPTMSKNRLSYNALRNYYSTIAMNDLRFQYGLR